MVRTGPREPPPSSDRPVTHDDLRQVCRAAVHSTFRAAGSSCSRGSGSGGATDRWLDLGGGGDADGHPEQRDAIVAIVAIAREVGLEASVEDGVLRVQKTQQLHDEIGARWI